MAGSVTENVTKLSFGSERMQAAERASQLRSRLQSSIEHSDSRFESIHFVNKKLS